MAVFKRPMGLIGPIALRENQVSYKARDAGGETVDAVCLAHRAEFALSKESRQRRPAEHSFNRRRIVKRFVE